MVFLIPNTCKTAALHSHLFISLSLTLRRALKSQMALVQTLSDNHQTQLDTNEQQIEQV